MKTNENNLLIGPYTPVAWIQNLRSQLVMNNARERRTVNNELKGKRYDNLKSSGEKDYLMESNGIMDNCKANVMQI